MVQYWEKICVYGLCFSEFLGVLPGVCGSEGKLAIEQMFEIYLHVEHLFAMFS